MCGSKFDYRVCLYIVQYYCHFVEPRHFGNSSVQINEALKIQYQKVALDGSTGHFVYKVRHVSQKEGLWQKPILSESPQLLLKSVSVLVYKTEAMFFQALGLGGAGKLLQGRDESKYS